MTLAAWQDRLLDCGQPPALAIEDTLVELPMFGAGEDAAYGIGEDHSLPYAPGDGWGAGTSGYSDGEGTGEGNTCDDAYYEHEFDDGTGNGWCVRALGDPEWCF